MIGLYIHIPFCRSKCSYCAFHSLVASEQEQADYIELLLQEMALREGSSLSTIYIGGGTPSVLSPHLLTRLLDGISYYFDNSALQEFTVEVNPESLTLTKANILMKGGVTRISMGLQDTDNKVLKAIGRQSTSEDFIRAYDELVLAGFTNISVDLMTGLPHQTLQHLSDSFSVISTRPNIRHVSVYGLTIEEDTLFERRRPWLMRVLPDEDTEREMFHWIDQKLIQGGWARYEISNYAKKGFESIHNSSYWAGKDYIGLGLSAVSTEHNIRYENERNLSDYRAQLNNKQLPRKVVEILDEKEKISERIILSLRCREGVNLLLLAREYHIDFYRMYAPAIRAIQNIEKQSGISLIEMNDCYMRLTTEGFDFYNIVAQHFLNYE